LAELEDLKADISKPAEGVVIESFLDSLKGAVVTLILEQGILKPGMAICTPSSCGKIKNLENFQRETALEAFPGQPVVVLGFGNVSRVGDRFKVVPDMETAKAEVKTPEKRVPEVIDVEEGRKVLNLVLKADVLGSLEAVEEILKNLPQEKVILRILKSEVGEITETDMKLALQGKAKILGFRVKANPLAQSISERENIKIMQFEIIYDLVESVRNYMEKILEPEIVRKNLGKMKTLVIFLTEKNRQIVGGKITEGEIKKGVSIEVNRGEEILGKGRVINLQINKKDVEKAAKGQECGILYEGSVKIEEGDTLIIYTEERKRQELE
jgi:translation initiation factor IF-2